MPKTFHAFVFSGLMSSLILSACSPRVEKPILQGRKGADGDPYSPGITPASPTSSYQPPIPSYGPEGTSETPGTAQSPMPSPYPMNSMNRTFAFNDGKGLKLGPKAVTGCANSSGAWASGIGSYLDFEVMEDDSTVTVSLDGLCGNLNAENMLLLLSDSKVLFSNPLPVQEVNGKMQILQQGLARGRYSLAIEAGGTTLKTLSSFVISGLRVESDKDLKFEGFSPF